jgi:integrase
MDPKHGDVGTQVTTVRHGTGKRWMARWFDHESKPNAKSFERKSDAQKYLHSVIAALTTGTYADPQRSSVEFGTVAEAWLGIKEGANRAPKTIAGYRGLLDIVILPKWKHERLRDITHERLQAWVTWLATDPAARKHPKHQRGDSDHKKAGLSPARVIQAHQVVHQVIAFAVRSKLIAVNTADDIELPRKDSPEKIALTHDQVRQLSEDSGEIATMVRTLAYTGLRFGECVALRVSDVDATGRRLTVSRSITGVRGQGRLEGPTKTHQSRTVPILTSALADELKEAVKGRNPTEFLFPGPDGDAMTVGWFRVRFDKAAVKLGIDGITPHTLRHTAGSLALQSGASVTTVQRLLGHRNPTTTLNVYAHMLDGDFDRLAERMEAAIKDSAQR